MKIPRQRRRPPAEREGFAAALARFAEPTRPIALARFHDGEYHVLQDLPYQARSGWTLYRPSWLRDRLRDALQADLDGYWVGISPPCDFPRATAFYRRLLKTQRLTFATIFAHRNFATAAQALRRGVFEKACLVSCKDGDYDVPANGVVARWDLDALVGDLLNEERPILVAAGPCAAIIVYEYWRRCPPAKRQTILDVGATLDLEIHGAPTREYHRPDSELRRHECSWKHSAPWTPKQLNQPARRWGADLARRNAAYRAEEES